MTCQKVFLEGLMEEDDTVLDDEKAEAKEIFEMEATVKESVDNGTISSIIASVLERKSSKLREQGYINVHFFVSQKQFWSLQSVYDALEAQGCFRLHVIPFPATTHTEEQKKIHFEELCAFHQERGANIVHACSASGEILIQPEQLDLDIVIYEQHWLFAYPFEYSSIQMFNHALCLCFPYGVMMANIPKDQFNGITHNLAWYTFVETPLHYKMSVQHAFNKGINTVVSGYPKLDAYKQPIAKNYWKTDSPQIKRITWAPHYSINTTGCVNFSTFLEYATPLFNLVQAHPDKLEMILKPHPSLKSMYLKHDLSEKDFDDFIEKWNALPNASVMTEGNYLDLFKTSDAMILDSISFIAEYLVSGKPLCFLSKHSNISELLSHFNDFGRKVVLSIDVAYTIDDVYAFLTSVCNETASISQERTYLVESTLKINFGHVGEYVANFILEKLRLR